MSRAGLVGLSQQDGGGRPGWGLSCTTLPQVLPPRLITAGRRLLRGAGGIPHCGPDHQFPSFQSRDTH